MRSEIVSARASAIALRAERGLGVAIREGQERGEVLKRGQTKTKANQFGVVGEYQNSQMAPADLASQTELSGTGTQPGIYGFTDGVSDVHFEEAITEAKAEGNLSRANVARKCRCLDCRRPLRVAKSVAAQRGPVCRSRAGVNG
jgi:hypothetical protein